MTDDSQLSNVMTRGAPEAHQRALILKRRCAHCAEPVSARILLKGEACEGCGRVSRWQRDADADALILALDARWSRRRWWVYGILAASTFATGMFPLAATLLTVAAMIYARLAIIRSPLQWFDPLRRFTSRFTLRLWMLITGLMALVCNELLTLVPWANMPLKMLASVLFVALFVEGSIFFLRGRLRRAASGDSSLQLWEWGLPLGLTGAALGISAAAVAATLFIIEAAQGLWAMFLGWI